MAQNRFLLGSIAFGISFGLSLLTSRDPGRAIGAGLITAAASTVAAAVVDRRSYGQAESRLTTLKNHIRALKQRRAEAYQALIEIEAEREQLALNMSSLQMGSFHTSSLQMNSLRTQPLQLPGTSISSSRRLSWDLSAPVAATPAEGMTAPIDVKPHQLPTQIQFPKRMREDASSVISEATAAKQKSEANLKLLQIEATQLKQQISEHRQTRDRLTQELTELKSQQQQLENTAKALRDDIQDLENCRVELEQFLSLAEAKKQELETGSNPLQIALKHLQTQVTDFQQELHLLETQIAERRTQKEDIETQLAILEVQRQSTQRLAVSNSNQVTKNSSKNQPAKSGDISSQTAPSSPTEPATRKGISSSIQDVTSSKPIAQAAGTGLSLQRPKKAPLVVSASHPEKPSSEKPTADLPSEWTEFMVQLPDYELEVLKAIVEQNNPAAVIKRIAEENLTMPELLIDSINERALDTIGDLIIESSAGSSTATIAREHLKPVKKLIKTYEYLTQ